MKSNYIAFVLITVSLLLAGAAMGDPLDPRNFLLSATLNIKSFEFFVKVENVQLMQVDAIVMNNNTKQAYTKTAKLTIFKNENVGNDHVSIYKVESPEFNEEIGLDQPFGERISLNYKFASSQGSVSYSVDPNNLLEAGDYLTGGERIGKSDRFNIVNRNSNPMFFESKTPDYHMDVHNRVIGIQSGIQLGNCYNHVYTNKNIFPVYAIVGKNKFGETCPVQKEFYSQAQSLLGQIVIRAIPGVHGSLFIKPVTNYDKIYTKLANNLRARYEFYWSYVGQMDRSNPNNNKKIEEGKIYFMMNEFSKLILTEDPNEVLPFEGFVVSPENSGKPLGTFSSDELSEPNCADESAKVAFRIIESIAGGKKVLPTGSDVRMYDNIIKVYVALMHARKPLTTDQKDILAKLKQAYAPQMDNLIAYISNLDYSTLGNTLLFNTQKIPITKKILEKEIVESPF